MRRGIRQGGWGCAALLAGAVAADPERADYRVALAAALLRIGDARGARSEVDRINPASCLRVLPIEAGFVGPDNVGVLIAEEPNQLEEKVPIIDIGTNGELLLGNRDGVSSTSCATGPSFEGAQIRFGMRARGKRVEADREARKVRFLEIAVDPNFQREFMQAMHIPHMKDAFPNLKQLLAESHPNLVLKG